MAPGRWGVVNAFSPKYCDLSAFAGIEPRPDVLWVRGADDRTVSDASAADFGYLGKVGLVPNWPGEEVYPPQPMVSQIRALFEHSTDIVTILEPDGTWRSTSPAGERLLGWPAGYEPTAAGVLEFVHDDDKELAATSFGEVFAGTSNGLFKVSGESDMVSIDLGPPGDKVEILPVTAIVEDAEVP